MIKGKDIIVHGLQSLDSPIGSNCVNLAYEFSKHNRILYVNYPMDRLTLLRRKKDTLVIKRKEILSGKSPELEKIQDNMWNLNPKTTLESISKIKSKILFSFFNKINNKRYAKRIQKAIDELGFKDYIIFNDSDFYRALYFKEYLKPKVSVYYTRDNMRATKFFNKHGAYFEDQLMEKSDLVVANSVYLQQIAKNANPSSFYVGQGCDVSIFDKNLIKELPEDIKNINNPIIGYIGALKSSRLDIGIFEHIAKSKPEWNIVLVGTEDDQFKQSKLHQLGNILFLGLKPMKLLPAYLKAFDIALNPQALNPLTIGNYPRKIDEYLAMGKPVVATKTKTMQVFKEFVYLAKNKEEYISHIEKALFENSDELEMERIKFARQHTWENNVKAIYKAIASVTL
jgi:glycosyltransferase involved in cell wall biosynthesis